MIVIYYSGDSFSLDFAALTTALYFGAGGFEGCWVLCGLYLKPNRWLVFVYLYSVWWVLGGVG